MHHTAYGAVRGTMTGSASLRAPTQNGARWLRWIGGRVRARHVLVLLAVLAYPAVAPPFFTFQIGAQALALGLIALSLTFLAGYGGMVSLAQMTVAGIAGYMYAIFATSGTEVSLGWPWWLAVLLALAIATVCGTLIGWFSVRTEGIYTIMITLAIGVAEQFGLAYAPTYSVVFTFVIMALVLAFRPQGILGRRG